MTLSENRALRWSTLCLLYMAQGIPWGFATVTLKAYLSGQNLGVDRIGQLIAMVTIPWSFKWVWGPVIDSVTWPAIGRRRPWILIAQFFMSATILFLLLAGDPAEKVTTIGWLLLVHNVFVSLQDVSVDALAVDLLDDSERGRVNGLMYGSSFFGTFLGGAVLGRIVASEGLPTALTAWLGLNFMIMLVPAFLRERPGERLVPGRASLLTRTRSTEKDSAGFRRSLVNLLHAFSQPTTILAALLAILIKIGSGTLAAVAVVKFMEIGWTQQEFTDLDGGWATMAGLCASFAGGWLADWFGARRVVGLASVTLGIVWIVFGFMESSWTSRPLVISLLLSQEILLSVVSVGLFSLFMRISWPVVAATQFTAYMSLLNLSTTIGAGSAGSLVRNLTVPEIYQAAGFLQIGVPLLLFAINPKKSRPTDQG